MQKDGLPNVIEEPDTTNAALDNGISSETNLSLICFVPCVLSHKKNLKKYI